ncbi:MAG: hypothetical protein ACI9OJ_001281 [Myxococcota bacterium]|jgi:hypothetical protein
MTRSFWVIGLLLGMGCQDSVAPQQSSPTALAPSLGTASSALEGPECAVSDSAWVTRAILAIRGRRPLGIREVEVWTDLVESSGREAAVRAMVQTPQARARLTEIILDLLSVNRFGERVNDACAQRELPDVTSDLAAHVKAVQPRGMAFGSRWTFTDLVHSALVLDDLSPVFLAGLFAQHGSRVIDADDPDDDIAFRQLYASIFERSYLNRRMDCLRCHNSEYAVVETHFPLPGHVERAIFGDSAGRADADLNVFFRVPGVLSMEFIPDATDLDFWRFGKGESPWGMSEACGQFVAPDAIKADPFGSNGYLVREFGPTASIWDLEGLLRAGFTALDGRALPVDDATGDVPGEQALAWMVSMRIAEGFWQTLTGHPLTTPNFFPRNPDQRDLLLHLTETFVGAGYSTTELLVAILTHPYFLPASPSECAPDDNAYRLPAIFDPWVDMNEVEDLRLNSAGDLVTRIEPRLLLTAASSALEWSEPDLLALLGDAVEGEEGEEPEGVARLAMLQTNLGLFVSDSEIGFRGSNFSETLAYEEAFGACRAPWEESPPPADFIDRLVQAGQDRPFEDLVGVLKDRLLTDADLSDPEERALLEALSGTQLSAVSGTLDDADGSLRRVCAAFLAAPQFVLDGVARPMTHTPTPPTWVVDGASRADFCAEASALADGFVCP